MIITPITKAKANLTGLIKKSDTQDIYITQRGEATAVIISASRYEELLERMDDMQDSLDIYHTDTSDTIPFEQVLKETGITL